MIRPLTKEDFPAYYFIRRESLRQNPEAFYTRLADFDARPAEKEFRRFMFSVTQPDRFILGAFRPSGEVIGMTGFGRHQTPGFEHTGFIWGVFVLQEFRGQAIGRQLLIKTIELAGQMSDLREARLGVMGDNRPAINLYRQVGFVEFVPSSDDPMRSGSGDNEGVHFRFDLRKKD